MENGGGKHRRRSSEKRIGVYTDSGNSGYLGGRGARLPPLCGARIEAIVGNGLNAAAAAADDKRHMIVKAKKRRPSISNLEQVRLCDFRDFRATYVLPDRQYFSSGICAN